MVTGTASFAAVVGTLLGLFALLLAAAKKGRLWSGALLGFVGAMAAAGFAITTDRIGRAQTPAIPLPTVTNEPVPVRPSPPQSAPNPPVDQRSPAEVTPAAMVGEFEFDLEMTVRILTKSIMDEIVITERFDPATSGDRLTRLQRLTAQKVAEAYAGRSINIRIDSRGKYKIRYEVPGENGSKVLLVAGDCVFLNGAVDLVGGAWQRSLHQVRWGKPGVPYPDRGDSPLPETPSAQTGVIGSAVRA